MKKLFICAAISASTLAATTSHAQLQKGNLMVGANLANIGLGLQKGNTDFSFNISPRLGYFVADNIAIGGEVILGFNTNSASTKFNYGVGAFGRYYVSDPRTVLLKQARFFGEVSLGLVGDNLRNRTTNVNTTTNGLGIGFGPGVAYFITPNVGLEAMVKYNLGVGFGTSTTTNNLGINVGFQIYLPTKEARKMYNNVKKEVESED